MLFLLTVDTALNCNNKSFLLLKLALLKSFVAKVLTVRVYGVQQSDIVSHHRDTVNEFTTGYVWTFQVFPSVPDS